MVKTAHVPGLTQDWYQNDLLIMVSRNIQVTYLQEQLFVRCRAHSFASK